MRESGGVPVEMIRVFELHIERYPNSAKRTELERSLARLAVDTRDEARILKYGDKLLAVDPTNLLMLERLSRALSNTGKKEDAQRARELAQRLARRLESELRPEASVGGRISPDELDRAVSRAQAVEARALGVMGEPAQAAALAAGAWKLYPLAEAAREEARWLEQSGDKAGAIEAWARAFASPDPRAQEEDRLNDRKSIGKLYRDVHQGSETGLGDVLLQAYDLVNARLDARKSDLRDKSPNALAKSPLDFRLSALQGEPLDLKSLKGKIVVLDFWATWCGPCRRQHPLYEEARAKFAGRNDVVFLAVNTDENRMVVSPFVKQNQWDASRIYFEDGLGRHLEISSIPTTVILGKNGEVASRMNGFIPERFVAMLTERIQDLLAR